MNFNVIFVLSIILSVGQTGMANSFYSVGPINGGKQSEVLNKEPKDSVTSHEDYLWKRTPTCPSGTTLYFGFQEYQVLLVLGAKYFM